MYRAMQIANYIVHLASKKGMDVTNLQIQKILYYLQAKTLVYNGRPLFKENIEKWRLGPVIPEVYHEYKLYGSQPIDEISTEMIFDDETFNVEFVEFDENDIDAETRDDISGAIITLLGKDAFELVDLTHEHTPWKQLRERIEDGEKGLKYSVEELYDYFTEHPEELNVMLGDSPR